MMFNLVISLIISLLAGQLAEPVQPISQYLIPTEITVNGTSTSYQQSKLSWSKSMLKLNESSFDWPKVNALAAAVVDWESGRVLWQKNPEQPVALASLTKLMTGLLAVESNLEVKDKIIVPKEAIDQPGASYLASQAQLSGLSLLNILLVASSNEAAETLASLSGRQNFVNQMNRRARTLGLGQAQFVGPAGLEAGNQATLSEVIKLIQVVFDKSIIAKLTSQPTSTVKVLSPVGTKLINFENTNKLFASGLTVLAGKTGTLEEAGFSVASIVAKPGFKPLLVIILGAPDHFTRFTEAFNLSNWAWQSYSF